MNPGHRLALASEDRMETEERRRKKRSVLLRRKAEGGEVRGWVFGEREKEEKKSKKGSPRAPSLQDLRRRKP